MTQSGVVSEGGRVQVKPNRATFFIAAVVMVVLVVVAGFTHSRPIALLAIVSLALLVVLRRFVR